MIMQFKSLIKVLKFYDLEYTTKVTKYTMVM